MGDDPKNAESSDIPATTTEAQKDASQAAQHVADATQQVAQAVTEVPSKAIADILSGVQGTLERVEIQLKRGNDLIEASSKKSSESENKPKPKPAVAPGAEVKKEEEKMRYIRRNGRRVKRIG